jgi:DNA-binding NarL/FixJ family response regulator
MVLENGKWGNDVIDRRSVTRLAEYSAAGKLGFVRVVYSYSVASAGLCHSLKKAGISHGIEAPSGSVPACVVLCVHDVEDLPEAMGSGWETKSTGEASDDSPIVIFALQNDLKLAEAALLGGARGFIHAGMTPKQILRALSVVSKGEVAAPRELLEVMLANRDSLGHLDALSARQREILDLVAEGHTNAQIGRRLFITEGTVKQHLRGAYKILGVKNRSQAAHLLRGAG